MDSAAIALMYLFEAITYRTLESCGRDLVGASVWEMSEGLTPFDRMTEDFLGE